MMFALTRSTEKKWSRSSRSAAFSIFGMDLPKVTFGQITKPLATSDARQVDADMIRARSTGEISSFALSPSTTFGIRHLTNRRTRLPPESVAIRECSVCPTSQRFDQDTQRGRIEPGGSLDPGIVQMNLHKRVPRVSFAYERITNHQ